MYCATDMGLINIHGQIRVIRVGIVSNNFRILIPLPPFRILRCKIPISELCAAS